MTQEAKLWVGIGLATVMIMLAGFFLFNGSDQQVEGATTVDSTVLLNNSNHKIIASNTKVTLVEFADFQCPACAEVQPQVKQLLEKYKDKITFVYRHFPLPQHQNARLAAKAVEVAGAQSDAKFWEMSAMLYEKQSEWSESDNARSFFITYARSLKLDVDAFTKAIDSDVFDQSIQTDYSDGVSLGINSTPTFFLNGKKLQLRSFADLAYIIESELQ